MFEESREYRDSFSSASLGAIKKTFRIYCDIIDESGAIATIATTLAVSGISIKNIGIVHNREFEEGALCIEFYDEATSQRAAQVLAPAPVPGLGDLTGDGLSKRNVSRCFETCSSLTDTR